MAKLLIITGIILVAILGLVFIWPSKKTEEEPVKKN